MTSVRASIVAAGALAATLAAGLVVRHFVTGPAGPTVATSQPIGIMGTQCALTAVADGPDAARRAAAGLDAAEQALRAVEARMSTYIELSELSRLNAAGPGQAVALSPGTMEVLRLARQMHEQTDGAFDATCLPLFRLWGQAGKARRLPSAAELAAARALCGWEKWKLLDASAEKALAGAGVGLGGIAKGWSIDRAAEAMQKAGCDGGLVDVGGDIRCFGPSPRGGKWRVAIRDPFHPREARFFGTLDMPAGAVCTSGNYERFSEIGGKRYSHIVDPRTGEPVDFAPSVTVTAPTAAEADGWATALSVLGPKGLDLLKAHGGVEAMLVVGHPDNYTLHQTPGFAGLLAEPIPQPAGKER